MPVHFATVRAASRRRSSRLLRTSGAMVMCVLLTLTTLFVTTGSAAASTWGFEDNLYGVDASGNLKCYKISEDFQPSYTSSFWPPSGSMVGVGWLGPQTIFPSGDYNNNYNIVYRIDYDGNLHWYQHLGSDSCDYSWQKTSGKIVDTGWNYFDFDQVFANGQSQGVIYAIDSDGTLYWYKHVCYASGEGIENPGCWLGPREIGSGWDRFTKVFAAADGVIYGIAPNGDLYWYRHSGWQTGDATWASNSGKVVGSGWGNFVQVLANGRGRIYAVRQDGALVAYLHYGYFYGGDLSDPTAWAGPYDTGGRGWTGLTRIFAGYQCTYFIC